ncbi:unnamed protein product, partial [Notodromas monacha]
MCPHQKRKQQQTSNQDKLLDIESIYEGEYEGEVQLAAFLEQQQECQGYEDEHTTPPEFNTPDPPTCTAPCCDLPGGEGYHAYRRIRTFRSNSVDLGGKNYFQEELAHKMLTNKIVNIRVTVIPNITLSDVEYDKYYNMHKGMEYKTDNACLGMQTECRIPEADVS